MYCKPWMLIGILMLAAGPGFPTAPAQENFDVRAYQTFLNSNSSLTSQGLLDLHPAGEFVRELPLDLSAARYLDSIDYRYKLTADEKDLLRNNGFVVSDRLTKRTFGQAFEEIFHHDLPVFVSADAILHPVHMSYDKILMYVEENVLIGDLTELLRRLHQTLPELAGRYDTVGGMQNSIDDIDLYFTVARTLLGDRALPYRDSNVVRVDTLLSLIAAEKPAYVTLFSSVPRLLDFSQFTTRGHYTISGELEKYFKSMIWLGRTEMQLLPPEGTIYPPPPEDIHRQSVDAFLILESLDEAGADTLYRQIDDLIRLFVGESDNITIENLRLLREESGVADAGDFLDTATLASMQSILRDKSFAVQRINSQILITDPMDPTQIRPPAAFLLLGQRFVIDSYVTANVVYDRILSEGKKVWRQLPSRPRCPLRAWQRRNGTTPPAGDRSISLCLESRGAPVSRRLLRQHVLERVDLQRMAGCHQVALPSPRSLRPSGLHADCCMVAGKDEFTTCLVVAVASRQSPLCEAVIHGRSNLCVSVWIR